MFYLVKPTHPEWRTSCEWENKASLVISLMQLGSYWKNKLKLFAKCTHVTNCNHYRVVNCDPVNHSFSGGTQPQIRCV